MVETGVHTRRSVKDKFVVDDPKAFTKPWLITRVYRRHPGLELKEFVCENARKQ